MITFGGSILKYGSQWLTDAETPPVLPTSFQPGDLVFRTPSNYDYSEDNASPVKYVPEYNYWVPTNSSDPAWIEQETENGRAYIVNMKTISSLANLSSHCRYQETVVGYWDSECPMFSRDGGNWRHMKSALMFVDVDSLHGCLYDAYELEKLQIVTIPTERPLVDLSHLCHNCTMLYDLNLTYLDTSHVTDFTDMCSGCRSLQTAPNIDTTSGTDFLRMFQYCDLLEVPQYNMPAALNVDRMFDDNQNVTTGALSLYNQIKDNPDIDGQMCFVGCGVNTETGRADLDQIPQYWGGELPDGV